MEKQAELDAELVQPVKRTLSR